ncbi:ABC transporter ATP-binding protein [Fructilactobacillus vespulae]|uniref:ABC transporter ATP-binding protein n=1 Tax=Fructilactobacillus vespulae TaxID=1249630 RepID=UPI0039B40C6A
MSFIVTKNLTKSFGNFKAVSELNLTINRGEFVTILGPNGSGKSTTIEMMTGLLQPNSGSIEIDGIGSNEKNYRNRIGVVFQNSLLDKQFSVIKNLKIRAEMYSSVTETDILAIAKLIGIDSFLEKKYGVLSGGQRRRVDIARALLSHPQVLFLDEPTTGLDVQTRTAIWEVLEKLQSEWKTTIILTTQYLEEAENSDFIYIIDHGKMLIHDTVPGLKARYPQNLLVITSNHLDKIQVEKDSMKRITEQKVTIKVETPATAIKILKENEPYINNFEFRENTMDDIFMELTGREMR